MATLRPLPDVARVTGYRRDTKWRGPDRNDHCPWGSRRHANACHAARDGSWMAAPRPPLLSGAVTGYSHPGCYAAASNDCTGKLTREHWLSAAVQRALAPTVFPPSVSGAPWLHGQSRALHLNALAARVLCARHNNALSPLDDTAERVLAALRVDQLDLASSPDSPVDAFTLATGPPLSCGC